MNQPPLDRAAFLRTLRRCHTEEQLFSRLTFACLAQYDEAQRPELLDDVRGAAYSLRLPAVEYKTDQWLHRCQDAIDTDRDAFLAAANAEAGVKTTRCGPSRPPSGRACWPTCPCKTWTGWSRTCCPGANFPCWVPTAAPAKASGRRS